jgi:hypothetical protein
LLIISLHSETWEPTKEPALRNLSGEINDDVAFRAEARAIGRGGRRHGGARRAKKKMMEADDGLDPDE